MSIVFILCYNTDCRMFADDEMNSVVTLLGLCPILIQMLSSSALASTILLVFSTSTRDGIRKSVTSVHTFPLSLSEQKKTCEMTIKLSSNWKKTNRNQFEQNRVKKLHSQLRPMLMLSVQPRLVKAFKMFVKWLLEQALKRSNIILVLGNVNFCNIKSNSTEIYQRTGRFD